MIKLIMLVTEAQSYNKEIYFKRFSSLVAMLITQELH